MTVVADSIAISTTATMIILCTTFNQNQFLRCLYQSKTKGAKNLEKFFQLSDFVGFWRRKSIPLTFINLGLFVLP
uniref:Uncharacterized protein n=1 Tax=Tetranychus urticae TaxID=32264 RepID=T1JZJ5_TETUR